MSEAFATVENISTLWRPLTASETTRAGALLPLVSDELRVIAKGVNKDIDAMVAADPAYASVAEASEKLAKAVNDYNGQAALANAEFKKANEVAANTCGIGKGVNPVADHVIALIKKFFED
jgi:hypothetical protein